MQTVLGKDFLEPVNGAVGPVCGSVYATDIVHEITFRSIACISLHKVREALHQQVNTRLRLLLLNQYHAFVVQHGSQVIDKDAIGTVLAVCLLIIFVGAVQVTEVLRHIALAFDSL